MNKIRTIVGKEWAEVFRNRLVLFSVAFLPLILLAIPLITLTFFDGMLAGDANLAGSEEFSGLTSRCGALDETQCLQIYMLDLFTLMFMILPVAIPVSIASYSIVGEKSTHSLEPLLATPITTVELLVAKALAAVLPAIIAVWSAYIIYLVAARFLVDDAVFRLMLDPMWLMAIFVVSPLLALLSVSFAVIVSSRVSDPRVAEQVSTIVILPIIMIIIGQSVGFILISAQLILLLGLIVLVADVILIYLAIQLFEREAILTKWK